MLVVGRQMDGFFDDITSAVGGAVSTVLHTGVNLATAPIKAAGAVATTALQTAAGVVNTGIRAAGSVAGTGVQVAGGVAGKTLSAVGGALPGLAPQQPTGLALAPPPAPSNTPFIIAGVGIALVLGFVLLSRRPSAPAQVAA